MSATTPLKQKLGMAVMNFSSFPYENSRRANNNTGDLEEVDNLNNKLEVLSKDAQSLQRALLNVKESKNECRATYFQFCQNVTDELDTFSQAFEESLRQCYSSLSSLRRETNEELKANRLDFDKLRGDMNICTSFTSDLRQKASVMVTDYVKTASSHEEFKGEQLMFDFEEISSIRKSSRGATGDMSRRTKRNDIPLTSNRKSDELKLISGRDNKFVLNGKEIDILNFEEES
jgi:hypothetical protein